MRTSALLLAAALLAGCAEDPAADNYGWGWHYDQESPATGLRVRYEPDVPPDWIRPIETLDTAWLETAACLGVAPGRGPLVIVTDRAVWCAGAMRDGCAYPDTRTVVAHRHLGELRHEYVHILLNRTDHEHPGFDTCGQPQPLETNQPLPSAD